MNKAPMSLGDWLRLQGLTQVEFAHRLGVEPNTVYRWLLEEPSPHKRVPRHKAIEKIVRETGGMVTADSFFLRPARAVAA